MNLYASLSDVKSNLGITSTTHDTLLMVLIESASRFIDNYCHRHFYVETATRYFDTGRDTQKLMIDDILSVTTLTTDSEDDYTFDGETWTEDTDFEFFPYNVWPKQNICTIPGGSYSFRKEAERYVKIIGLWGYGDGKSATPYSSGTGTVTFSNATTASGTLSSSGAVVTGQTILAGTEQIYVGSASGTTLSSCERGVNGTTGATHTTAAFSIYEYPQGIKQACIWLASQAFNMRQNFGFSSMRLQDHQWSRAAGGTGTLGSDPLVEAILNPYRRTVFV